MTKYPGGRRVNERSRGSNRFACPVCGVIAQQLWLDARQLRKTTKDLIGEHFYSFRTSVPDHAKKSVEGYQSSLQSHLSNGLEALLGASVAVATCTACNAKSIWIGEDLVYPKVCDHGAPNADMALEIQELYLEAARIAAESPRGAAALLRLALQKLLLQLGKKGDNINDDIKSLVENGLSPKIQQAMDILRVVGNNAVHPGQIVFDDRSDVANQLFRVLNFVAAEMLTRPRELAELYDNVVPESSKQQISKRDGSGS